MFYLPPPLPPSPPSHLMYKTCTHTGPNGREDVGQDYGESEDGKAEQFDPLCIQWNDITTLHRIALHAVREHTHQTHIHPCTYNTHTAPTPQCECEYVV